MQHTFFARVPAAPLIAHSYVNGDSGLHDYFAGAVGDQVPTELWGAPWTDGSVAASATDVARFFDRLCSGQVLQPATLAEMVLAGPDGSYGLGTCRYAANRHQWQGNNGICDGFTSDARYDAARKVTIVTLANRSAASDPVSAIWLDLSAAYGRAAP